MSHFWHAHWTEENFTPSRLQNWEIPRWHPDWPDRHCTTTKFEAHKTGRLLMGFQKPKNRDWSDFKGTWELPLKIDRSTAEQLSKSTEYKKAFWNAHRKNHKNICRHKYPDIKDDKNEKKKHKIRGKQEDSHKEKDQLHESQSERSLESNDLNDMGEEFKTKCQIQSACVL